MNYLSSFPALRWINYAAVFANTENRCVLKETMFPRDRPSPANSYTLQCATGLPAGVHLLSLRLLPIVTSFGEVGIIRREHSPDFQMAQQQVSCELLSLCWEMKPWQEKWSGRKRLHFELKWRLCLLRGLGDMFFERGAGLICCPWTFSVDSLANYFSLSANRWAGPSLCSINEPQLLRV